MRYSKLTPCSASENKSDTKEDKGAYIHDACIVRTVIRQKAPIWAEAMSFSEKKHVCSFSGYQVTLVCRRAGGQAGR